MTTSNRFKIISLVDSLQIYCIWFCFALLCSAWIFVIIIRMFQALGRGMVNWQDEVNKCCLKIEEQTEASLQLVKPDLMRNGLQFANQFKEYFVLKVNSRYSHSFSWWKNSFVHSFCVFTWIPLTYLSHSSTKFQNFWHIKSVSGRNSRSTILQHQLCIEHRCSSTRKSQPCKCKQQ